ncbi:MAG: LPS assembly protein LptD [Planctomycetes bacterium]|nr:LPS assembly protein LptD [Planctomycetota bacterium]
MVERPRISQSVLVVLFGAVAFGQRPTPIADSVDQALVPYGISEHAVTIGGQLAHFFSDDQGTDVLHVVGGFSLNFADAAGLDLRSREAVLWLTNREYQARPYTHLQVFLWQDAEVREVGDTVTSGPALYITLNTFGKIRTSVDDMAFEASSTSQVYVEARALRTAIAASDRHELDKDSPFLVFDATGLDSGPKKPKVRPPITLHFPGEFHKSEVDGQRVITIIGGAYMSRGDSSSRDFLEIRADMLVVFLPPDESKTLEREPGKGGLGRERQGRASDVEREKRTTARRRRSFDRQDLSSPFGDEAVEAVYLEGDVIMAQGPNKIRASRLYYDFVEEKALILDAVVRTELTERGIPLSIRAAEIRQLSTRRFVASDAVFTTSDFHTPHYHIGAGRVELTDRTPLGSSGAREGIRAGSFQITDATLNLHNVPVAYWPSVRGRLDTSETAIRSLRLGYSDDFGVEVETDWHLLNVMGLETPEGFDATLKLDYFSERGPAIGVDVDYERDRYNGLIRSYLLTDDGVDSLSRDRENVPTQDVRGRFLLRHRQYLEDDWQLTLELAYVSDDNFLEEFFEKEFDNDKAQETLLYLKKQRDNWAFTAHVQGRLMDSTTVTERYPDLAFFRVGRTLGDWLTWHSQYKLGVVRYRPTDQTFREFLRDGKQYSSSSVGRVDSRQEFEAPVDVGPFRFVPFASGRTTAWDDSPFDGGLARLLTVAGVRGSTYLSKVSPGVRSALFDIDGVRHIVKSDVVAWVGASNRDPDDLFPFDERVEGAQGLSGVALGLRQRWQTKRGQGDNRRTVDFLTFDVEVGFFDDPDGEATTNGYTSYARPENAIARNYINSSLVWRLNDRTALLSEMNYDTNDGEIDIFNVSLAVERPPRFSYLLGYRYIKETNSNLLGFDMNYRLTEKYTMAFRELFDLARGETLDFTIAIIRKFPRWFGAVSFELDEPEDDFGISFSVWPQGLPQAALGSRRFTGLANTTRLKRD